VSRLYIASRRIEHDGSRRVLTVGRIRGGGATVSLRARFGDPQAAGTRQAAELEAVRQAGYSAWDIYRTQQGEVS
jgi:hypothetical protein